MLELNLNGIYKLLDPFSYLLYTVLKWFKTGGSFNIGTYLSSSIHDKYQENTVKYLTSLNLQNCDYISGKINSNMLKATQKRLGPAYSQRRKSMDNDSLLKLMGLDLHRSNTNSNSNSLFDSFNPRNKYDSSSRNSKNNTNNSNNNNRRHSMIYDQFHTQQQIHFHSTDFAYDNNDLENSRKLLNNDTSSTANDRDFLKNIQNRFSNTINGNGNNNTDFQNQSTLTKKIKDDFKINDNNSNTNQNMKSNKNNDKNNALIEKEVKFISNPFDLAKMENFGVEYESVLTTLREANIHLKLPDDIFVNPPKELIVLLKRQLSKYKKLKESNHFQANNESNSNPPVNTNRIPKHLLQHDISKIKIERYKADFPYSYLSNSSRKDENGNTISNNEPTRDGWFGSDFFIPNPKDQDKLERLVLELLSRDIEVPKSDYLDIYQSFRNNLFVSHANPSRLLSNSKPITDFGKYCQLNKEDIFRDYKKTKSDFSLFWTIAISRWQSMDEFERNRKIKDRVSTNKYADKDELSRFLVDDTTNMNINGYTNRSGSNINIDKFNDEDGEFDEEYNIEEYEDNFNMNNSYSDLDTIDMNLTYNYDKINSNNSKAIRNDKQFIDNQNTDAKHSISSDINDENKDVAEDESDTKSLKFDNLRPIRICSGKIPTNSNVNDIKEAQGNKTNADEPISTSSPTDDPDKTLKELPIDSNSNVIQNNGNNADKNNHDEDVINDNAKENINFLFKQDKDDENDQSKEEENTKYDIDIDNKYEISTVPFARENNEPDIKDDTEENDSDIENNDVEVEVNEKDDEVTGDNNPADNEYENIDDATIQISDAVDGIDQSNFTILVDDTFTKEAMQSTESQNNSQEQDPDNFAKQETVTSVPLVSSDSSETGNIIQHISDSNLEDLRSVSTTEDSRITGQENANDQYQYYKDANETQSSSYSTDTEDGDSSGSESNNPLGSSIGPILREFYDNCIATGLTNTNNSQSTIHHQSSNASMNSIASAPAGITSANTILPSPKKKASLLREQRSFNGDALNKKSLSKLDATGNYEKTTTNEFSTDATNGDNFDVSHDDINIDNNFNFTLEEKELFNKYLYEYLSVSERVNKFEQLAGGTGSSNEIWKRLKKINKYYLSYQANTNNTKTNSNHNNEVKDSNEAGDLRDFLKTLRKPERKILHKKIKRHHRKNHPNESMNSQISEFEDNDSQSLLSTTSSSKGNNKDTKSNEPKFKSLKQRMGDLLDVRLADLSHLSEFRDNIVKPNDLYERFMENDKQWVDLTPRDRQPYYEAFKRKYINIIDDFDNDAYDDTLVEDVANICYEFGDKNLDIVTSCLALSSNTNTE